MSVVESKVIHGKDHTYDPYDELRRICSSDETFKQRSNELKSYLNKRGYNLSFLNQEVARVHNITRTQALTPKDTFTTYQPQRVPLVITYNPALRYISSIITDKYFNILSSSPRCTNVFKAKPFVAFRRSNNLNNILVSAKLHKPSTAVNAHRGSFLCGNNCLTCNYINDGLINYTFIVLLAKLDLLIITLTATPKTVSTWYNVTTVTNNT